MPMNPLLLGAGFVKEVGPTDALSIVGFLAKGIPYVQWTQQNLTANPFAGTPLIAAGTTIVGTGGFSVGSPGPLVQILADAIGIKDKSGLEKLGIVTQHYADTLTKYGQIDPSGLIAYAGPAPPPTGVVTGTGKVKLSDDFHFYDALKVTDKEGVAHWKAYGKALRDHLENFATVTPAGMTNPAAGGVVSGSGTVS